MNRKSRIYDPCFGLLENKKVTIVGCGGTGSWLAELLAKTGINLLLVDPDVVEESNLERQNFYYNEIGKPKVLALKQRLSNFSNIDILQEKVDEKNIRRLAFNDLLVDCTDSFENKRIISEFAVEQRKEYLITSVQKNHGLIYLYRPSKKSITEIYKNKIFKELNSVGVTNSAVLLLASLAASIIYAYLLSKEIPEEILYFNLEKYEIIKIKA